MYLSGEHMKQEGTESRLRFGPPKQFIKSNKFGTETPFFDTENHSFGTENIVFGTESNIFGTEYMIFVTENNMFGTCGF